MKNLFWKIVTWKCPLLPTLTMPIWHALWALNFGALLVYMGGQLAGWWPVNTDITLAVNVINVLLIVTPLEHVYWMVGPKGGDKEDFRFVKAREAKRILHAEVRPSVPLEVLCFTTRKDEVVRIAWYTPKETS